MPRARRKKKGGSAFPMLTNCKNLPSDVKSISPGIIQSHAFSLTLNWTCTRPGIHQMPRRAIFRVHLRRQPRSRPTSIPSLSISPKIKLVYSQPVAACLAACTICCQLGEDGSAQQSEAPASTAGTANPSSREITQALVKSQRRSLGRFQLPQEMKRRRGGGGSGDGG